MKSLKIFSLMMLLALAVVGCEKTSVNGSSKSALDGEWVLTSWNEAEPEFNVYIDFNEDNTFDLYQHTTDVLWVHYTGTYSLKGNTLSGVYSDGESWATSYTIKYNKVAEPKQISLTSSDNVGIYTATTIPDAVIDQATEAVVARSVATERFL